MTPPAPEIVLFDAFGTLVDMEPPAPVLCGLLADAGCPLDEAVVHAALRQEIAHYRSRMHIGRDAVGLAALRAECGAVLARALGPGAPGPDVATDLLVQSLRFRLYDDALPALDDAHALGLRVGVVSNWDCALPVHLERLGVADRFAVIAVSAPVGAPKPDPAIFHPALRVAGVDPSRALHVGDRRVEDYEGARTAGMRALLLDRHGNEAGPDVITTLLDVAGRIRE